MGLSNVPMDPYNPMTFAERQRAKMKLKADLAVSSIDRLRGNETPPPLKPDENRGTRMELEYLALPYSERAKHPWHAEAVARKLNYMAPLKGLEAPAPMRFKPSPASPVGFFSLSCGEHRIVILEVTGADAICFDYTFGRSMHYQLKDIQPTEHRDAAVYFLLSLKYPTN